MKNLLIQYCVSDLLLCNWFEKYRLALLKRDWTLLLLFRGFFFLTFTQESHCKKKLFIPRALILFSSKSIYLFSLFFSTTQPSIVISFEAGISRGRRKKVVIAKYWEWLLAFIIATRPDNFAIFEPQNSRLAFLNKINLVGCQDFEALWELIGRVGKGKKLSLLLLCSKMSTDEAWEEMHLFIWRKRSFPFRKMEKNNGKISYTPKDSLLKRDEALSLSQDKDLLVWAAYINVQKNRPNISSFQSPWSCWSMFLNYIKFVWGSKICEMVGQEYARQRPTRKLELASYLRPAFCDKLSWFWKPNQNQIRRSWSFFPLPPCTWILAFLDRSYDSPDWKDVQEGKQSECHTKY